jgi:hypothetical protein
MTSIPENCDDWVIVPEKKDLHQETTFNDVILDGSRTMLGFKNIMVSSLGVVGGVLQVAGAGITATGTTIVWVSCKCK